MRGPLDVTFLYPLAGWLLLLVPLIVVVARRPRDARHIALRIAVVAAVVLALMQPSLVYRAGAGTQVYVLDQRAELGSPLRATARATLERVLRAAPADGARVLIQLGGAPVRDGVAGTIARRERVEDGSLATALARAVAAMPLGAEGAVTIVADPRSTGAHWEDARAALAMRRIPVDTVALARPARGAFVADVRIASARVGEAVPVTVMVEGDGGEHRVTLSGASGTLATSASFVADGPTAVSLRFPADRAGFVPVRATLDDDRAGGVAAVAAVQDPLPLLYAGDGRAGAAALLQRLLGRGVAVTERAPAALADRDLARWPLLFVDDVPAARLPLSAQRAIAAAVAERGTGLIVSGGKAAFGAGGDAGTPLAATLPVTARPEERLERPSIALAVVIDSSGSMSGDPMELAKQVARQTIRKLTATDWAGVVEFYGAKQWAVPMQPARDTATIERAIGRMEANGSSVLFPALQEAYYGLKDVPARYKHLLVISDGGVAEDRYQQLLRHIADDRIAVSTVVVGNDRSGEESMAQWARIGRGRFYSVADENSLVSLDFRQPQIKPDPGYRSGGFAVRPVPGMLAWQGIARVPPPLTGYARVAARPDAQTMLATATGDPILASWQVGSGRATALMTEPLGAGTAGWRAWPDYGRWLARVVAMTARQRPDLAVTIDRRFERLTIAARRTRPADRAAPRLRLLDAAGRPLAVAASVEERAPGLFVASLPFAADRPALVEWRDGDRVVRAADRAASDRHPVDALPAGSALPLAQLSADTGGWHREGAGAPPGAAHPGGGAAAVDLWPWLALLALLLYLCDILYRRLPSRRPAGNR